MNYFLQKKNQLFFANFKRESQKLKHKYKHDIIAKQKKHKKNKPIGANLNCESIHFELQILCIKDEKLCENSHCKKHM